MNRLFSTIIVAVLLHCAQAAESSVAAQVAASAGAAAAAAAPGVDADDATVNTFFRTQDTFTTSDASTEQNIPGLASTDYKKVWRSIPNLENFSPFITSVVPMLPDMKIMSHSMGWTFPMAWPLAGSSGDHKDWLTTSLLMYTRAMLRQGPRPLVFPTILIPTKAAYAKLAADVHKFSGLPNMTAVHDPAKKAIMAAAIYQQLMSNLYVVEAPKLSTAQNGTVVMTQGKVRLVLVVKPDGSRHLVSNTTTLKLVHADVGCQMCGHLTVQLVDSFVVPKMSAVPVRPDPLITEEELRKLPDNLQMVREGWVTSPKAISKMPAAAWEMLVRQLPDDQQEALKKWQQLPRLPKMFSLNVQVRAPERRMP